MSAFAVARRNRRVLEARWPELNTRKSLEGTEKLCGQCQEWLPLDEEFFSFIPSQGHYRSWCKCCEAESAQRRRRRARFFARVKAARRNWRQVVMARRAAWKEPQKQAA